MRSIYDDMRYVKVYIMTSFQIQAAKMHREFEGVKKRERDIRKTVEAQSTGMGEAQTKKETVDGAASNGLVMRYKRYVRIM